MARLKIPRTKRDFYNDEDCRILGKQEGSERGASEDANGNEQIGCEDEVDGETDAARANQNGKGSQMVPLVEPQRHKIRDPDNLRPELFSKHGKGDFLDMPTTREFVQLQLGVSPEPLLPKSKAAKDGLDSLPKETREQKRKVSGRSRSHLSRDQVDYELGRASFTYFDILVYVVSIGSYVFDVGSDCWVAYLYYAGGHWKWFSMTVAFITVPSIVMTAFSLKWYIIDHKHDKKHNRKTASLVRWVSRFMFMMLQLSPMLRYIDSLMFGCKSRKFSSKEHPEKLHWYHMMLYEDTDSCLLRLIECFMEAAPQLVLQLYIMCVQGGEDGVFVVIAQSAAIVTSLCSLAWSLTAYHRALRASLPEKENMRYSGMALQFLWRFFTVAARVIALALFAARFKAWVFLIIASHWMTMFIWIRFMQTKFCDTRVEELGFNLVAAAIYVFCFLNLIEGHTRLRYFIYYCLTFVEDAGLISTWYLFSQTKYRWYQNPAICAVFIGYVLGITFQVIYYLKAHPNNFAEDKSKAIRTWIPFKELISPEKNKMPQENSVSGREGKNSGNALQNGDAPGERSQQNLTNVQVEIPDPAEPAGYHTPLMQGSPHSRESSV